MEMNNDDREVALNELSHSHQRSASYVAVSRHVPAATPVSLVLRARAWNSQDARISPLAHGFTTLTLRIEYFDDESIV